MQQTFVLCVIRWTLTAVAVVLAANCGSRAPSTTTANPNAPSGQPVVLAATISGISPSQFVVGSAPQTVTFTGTNFLAGLTLSAAAGDGTPVTFQNSEITNLTPTSFTTSLVFSAPVDPLGFRVTNPGTAASNALAVTVKAAPIPQPELMAVAAGTAGSHTITFNGANFRSGLTVTASREGGETTVYSGDQIKPAAQSPTTAFDVFMTLAVGTYTFRVTNPDGAGSNVVTKSLAPEVPTNPAPTISSFFPDPLIARADDQLITVTGTNFVNGLTLTATDSSGTSIVVSGGRITLSGSGTLRTTMVLPHADTYSFQVTNPDGQKSNVRTKNVPGAGSPSCPVTSGGPRLTNIGVKSGNDPFVSVVGFLWEDDGTRPLSGGGFGNCAFLDDVKVSGDCQTLAATLECTSAGFYSVWRRTATTGSCSMAFKFHNSCGVTSTPTISFALPPLSPPLDALRQLFKGRR